MSGYTGLYKGKSISVQGSGMGQASLAIYTNELIKEYGVKNLIRVGSCGSYKKNIHVRDIIIAMSASTDSAMNRQRYNGWKKWAEYGVLGVEMESAALYTLAAKYGVRALTVCTVSDNLATQEFTTSEERETSFVEMMKLALETFVIL
jgi:purine-nucleoside phosphorylase